MTHQILTGHLIDLKLVANRAGWILMNLQIPQARRLSALICFIAILMVGGAETAPPPTLSRVKGNIRSFIGNYLWKSWVYWAKTAISDLNSDCVKSEFKHCPAPVGEVWRISNLQELLQIREGRLDVQGFTQHEIEESIEFVAVSWAFFPHLSHLPRFIQYACFLKKQMELSIYST